MHYFRYSKIHAEQTDYESALFKLKEDERLSQSYEVDFIENEDNQKIKNIAWPTIGEFSIQIGEKKIDEFIKTVKNMLFKSITNNQLK